MTNPPGKAGTENGGRAGTEALRVLSAPINVHVLRGLAQGSRSLTELRRKAGSPPQTTMRGHLRALIATGVAGRRRTQAFPSAVDFALTQSGAELWEVARVLEAWLERSPNGPLELGGGAAKSAIKALVEGWGTNMVRALAARPLSLTELNGLIAGLSYPSLERRLGAMSLAGQIERMPGPGRGTPYAVTDWLRAAIAPLAAAARWERVHVPQHTVPIRRLDIEAAFLLAVPLLRLPAELSGSCRMAVELAASNGSRLAGVLLVVRDGEIISCRASLQGHADAWASGSAREWLGAVMERDLEQLEIGGEAQLNRAVLEGLNGALFGSLRLEDRQPGT